MLSAHWSAFAEDCTTTGNSTGKMREFTGLNIILFPLALERIFNVQCDAR
jgi:hypothetical protein